MRRHSSPESSLFRRASRALAVTAAGLLLAACTSGSHESTTVSDGLTGVMPNYPIPPPPDLTNKHGEDISLHKNRYLSRLLITVIRSPLNGLGEKTENYPPINWGIASLSVRRDIVRGTTLDSVGVHYQDKNGPEGAWFILKDLDEDGIYEVETVGGIPQELPADASKTLGQMLDESQS